MVPSDGKECLHYTYLDLSKFHQQDGSEATRPDGAITTKETNRDILRPLGFPQLAQVFQCCCIVTCFLHSIPSGHNSCFN